MRGACRETAHLKSSYDARGFGLNQMSAAELGKFAGKSGKVLAW